MLIIIVNLWPEDRNLFLFIVKSLFITEKVLKMLFN